ncbi:MAG: alkaline phosphatase PhoX, partial [Pseudomonadota bacterium]|nr:alkaline phosphatase PhoX [Pseudomonadota bacterium]
MNHNPEFDDVVTPQQLRENAEDIGSNPTDNPTMGDIINRRFSRRGFLSGSLAVAAIGATVSPLALATAPRAAAAAGSAFSFGEIEAGVDENHHVAEGYDADILLRWGDKVFTDSPEFDPANQTAADQSRQFGYNNDFIGFIPIDGNPDHGLLCINHEYTNAELMFPNWARVEKNAEGKDKVRFGEYTKELVDIEIAAHGGTIIEIVRENGKWRPVLEGTMNRRITAETPMTLRGPAAGNDRLKTSYDPTGRKVLGTLNNCAGGITAWGTYLMAEENFNGNFMGELPADHAEKANYDRLGAPAGWYEWGRFHDRFDAGKEPNELNRFGWIVEVDPFDP